MNAHLQIILCAILWGTAGPLIRASGEATLHIVAVRFTLPILLAYLWLRIIDKDRLHPIGVWLALSSLLTAIGNALYIWAFSFTSITNVLLLLYTRPIMATVIAALLLGEVVRSKIWALLACSFLGAVLILSAAHLDLATNDLIGMMISLGAAFTTALAWGIIKKHGYGPRKPSEVLFYQHLVGAIIAMPMLPAALRDSSTVGLVLLTLYAVLIGFVATHAYFKGLQYLDISKAMPLTYIELVVAVGLGVLVFHDQLKLTTIIGGFMIVASSLLSLEKKAGATAVYK